MLDKYRQETIEIQRELNKVTVSISNPEKLIIQAVDLCQNLSEIWQSGSVATKEQLQQLVFPGGMVYDRKTGVVRTSEINPVFTSILRIVRNLEGTKKGAESSFEDQSPFVPRTGFYARHFVIVTNWLSV